MKSSRYIKKQTPRQIVESLANWVKNGCPQTSARILIVDDTPIATSKVCEKSTTKNLNKEKVKNAV